MNDIDVEHIAGVIFASGLALLFIIALVVLLSKLCLMRKSIKDLINNTKELEQKSTNDKHEAKDES